MKLRVTAGPFQSGRDGRWYVIVEHGQVVEHVRLTDSDGEDAVEVIGRVFGMSPMTARKAVNNPGTWVVFKVKPVKAKRVNRTVLDALERATTTRKVKR